MQTAVIIAAGILNLVAFCVCAWDKHAAKTRRRRVPERQLFLLSALGGSPGMLAGMYLFHHKTKKPAFYLGVPAILAVQLGLLWWFLR